MVTALGGRVPADELREIIEQRFRPAGPGGVRVVQSGRRIKHKHELGRVIAPDASELSLDCERWHQSPRHRQRHDNRITVVPDYRLIPEVRYPAFVEDGAAALRWATEHAGTYCGDGSAIVLMGHSAGADIAAMLAVDPRWLGDTRSAVKGLAGLAGPYDFAPFDVEASRAAFGQAPDPADPQPVTFAGAGDPPALLLYGSADTVVLPRNSEALAARLRAGGVAVDSRAIPSSDTSGSSSPSPVLFAVARRCCRISPLSSGESLMGAAQRNPTTGRNDP